jgi:hypothetical protein
MKRILLLILLVPAFACATTQAKSPADRPTLEMPPVPPRVIDAAPPEAAPPELVGEPPAAPAPAPPPRPRNQPPPRELAKPDPKPETAPVEQTVAAPPAPALPQLRTPGTPEGPEASRQVGDVVERARKMLASIDYKRLTAARRAEYESARLTITQSESALKSGKFDIALNLAEKAERIAKELQAR